MTDIYGLPHTLGMNDLNSRISESNRIAMSNNRARNDNYINNVKTAKTNAKQDASVAEGKESGDQTQAELDVGKIGTDVYETGTLLRAGGKIQKGAADAAEAAATTEEVNPVADEVTDFAAATSNIKGGAKSAEAAEISSAASQGYILGPVKKVANVAAPSTEATAADVGSGLAEAAEVTEDGVKAVAGVSKLVAASTALSIGQGALDAGEDIYNLARGQSAFGKDDTGQKIGNVSNIVSGVSAGLFAAGTALDASLVFAPEGLALQGLAGLAGLVGGIADYVGDEQEKSTTQTAASKAAAVSATPTAAPVQQKLQNLQAQGTTGQEVKVN